jgi:hypothetical protein
LASWKRYFRPLVQMVYYRSLFHLLVVNFPYALAAWIYLFVFTVVRSSTFIFNFLRSKVLRFLLW